jgi:two-component system, sensor histidine kinase and response regulator
VSEARHQTSDPSDLQFADPEHLRLVMDATPIAILVVDGNGTLVRVNTRVETLFGYGREELVGRSLEMLVPQRFRGQHPGLRGAYLAEPTTRAMGGGRDLFGLCKDGSEVPVEIGLNPIRTEQGDFVLAAVIDITERKHSEELRMVSAIETQRRLDAEAARDRALDASQLKSQFVATMSHELRTPLNAIIGMSELLSATVLEERQREYVVAVNESAEALLCIIKSILDFSKIEAGKLELESREFDLTTVVEGAASALEPQARQKCMAVHTYIDPLIPAVVSGDNDQLRQILLNLIGNAVKFTERGHIVVRALLVETSSPQIVVRFEVQDTGIGIDVPIQGKLFEPFVQADGSSSRRYGGTGLGLSISKRLAELMEGEIGVTSELGSGSLFWFTARFTLPTAVAPSPNFPGAFAFVASQDEVFAQIVMRYLEAWGMQARRVSGAGELREALRAASARGAVDCVTLVDAEGAFAQEIAALLRSDEFAGNARLITIGADETVVKPLRQSALFESIVNALARGAQTAPQGEVPRAEPPGEDRGPILVAEDNSNLQELLVHQFSRLGYGVTIVADGVQAVDAVRRRRFAIVFMDCQMPNMDGFEATRLIRNEERRTGDHVPIIAVTANAFKEDREACLAAGMDDYLSKPVRINELRAMIDRWMVHPASSTT